MTQDVSRGSLCRPKLRISIGMHSLPWPLLPWFSARYNVSCVINLLKNIASVDLCHGTSRTANGVLSYSISFSSSG